MLLHALRTEGIENCLDTEINGKKYKDILTELVSKTGEKTQIGDYQKFVVEKARFYQYIYPFQRKSRNNGSD